MLRCEWKHRKYQCFLTLVKKHCKLQCFWPPDLKNHGICSGFCFSPRKNTVNNSNFMFFVIFWTALVRYTWLSNSSRFFFSDNQYFRMLLVSMPLLCEPNDAVRAVAVAKRREYVEISNTTADVSPLLMCSWQSKSNKHAFPFETLTFTGFWWNYFLGYIPTFLDTGG